MNEKTKGYLISESVYQAEKINVISDKSGEPTVFETILQEGDANNRNKRNYPTSVIKNGLKSVYVTERLRTHSWYGEAGRFCPSL